MTDKSIECRLDAIECKLDRLLTFFEDPALQLPGKGVATTAITGAANVETIVNFRAQENQTWYLNAAASMSAVRLIGLDGQTIVTFPFGSIPSVRSYKNPEEIRQIGFTSTTANVRLTLWAVT